MVIATTELGIYIPVSMTLIENHIGVRTNVAGPVQFVTSLFTDCGIVLDLDKEANESTRKNEHSGYI